MSAVHFPAEVKLGQLVSFLRAVHALGSRSQVAKIARELHSDLVMLLPIMDAAEILELAVVEKGEVQLLKSGERLSSATKPDLSSLKSVLLGIEPFKTAEVLKRFTAEEIADEVARRGIRWHHEDAVNASVLRAILIHWGIPAGLVDYDGYSSEFTVISQG